MIAMVMGCAASNPFIGSSGVSLNASTKVSR